MREPNQHTVQAYLPLSQMPTWRSSRSGDRIAPRSLLLRVFAVSDGARGWHTINVNVG